MFPPHMHCDIHFQGLQVSFSYFSLFYFFFVLLVLKTPSVLGGKPIYLNLARERVYGL